MRFFLLFFCHLICIATYGQQRLLQSGPMVGYSEMREVMLWVQTKQAAEVKIGYWEKGKPNQKKFTATKTTLASEGYAAHLLADQVVPSKTYDYELYINDQLIQRDYPLSFQSQALWQWRTDPPTFRFALGSCAYVNDSLYDRPGKSYGGDYQIFKAIHQRTPDFKIWLGDNVYYREPDWGTRTGMIYRNTHTRSLEELQPLLGNVHHYAIWDDHDFGPNDADGSFVHKEMALDMFKLFWANLNYGAPEGEGVTGTFVWGDVQFFLLDDRYFRTANRNEAVTPQMMGKTQIDWLVNALAYSKASFKVVALGNQVLNPAGKYEGLINFKEEYDYLLQQITKAQIEGVLFISGDRHHTELTALMQADFYPLYDLTVSPLTSGAGNPKNENNTLRVANTLVAERNFAIVEVSGKLGERILTIQIYDKNNQLKWSKQISQQSLQLKKK